MSPPYQEVAQTWVTELCWDLARIKHSQAKPPCLFALMVAENTTCGRVHTLAVGAPPRPELVISFFLLFFSTPSSLYKLLCLCYLMWGDTSSTPFYRWENPRARVGNGFALSHTVQSSFRTCSQLRHAWSDAQFTFVPSWANVLVFFKLKGGRDDENARSWAIKSLSS